MIISFENMIFVDKPILFINPLPPRQPALSTPHAWRILMEAAVASATPVADNDALRMVSLEAMPQPRDQRNLLLQLFQWGECRVLRRVASMRMQSCLSIIALPFLLLYIAPQIVGFGFYDILDIPCLPDLYVFV